jgi:hypothetical protein
VNIKNETAQTFPIMETLPSQWIDRTSSQGLHEIVEDEDRDCQEDKGEHGDNGLRDIFIQWKGKELEVREGLIGGRHRYCTYSVYVRYLE